VNATPIRQPDYRRVLPALALSLALLLGVSTAGAQSAVRPSPGTVRAERVHSHETHADVQRVAIQVTASGYEPSVLLLEAGVPAELVFTRPDAAGCGDAVQIPALGVGRTALPVGEPVTIRVTPGEPGTYPFYCGMDMLRGELVVE